MKTLKTQKRKGIKRTVFSIALAAFITAGSVFAISNGNKRSSNFSETEMAQQVIKEQRRNAQLMEELGNLYSTNQGEDLLDMEIETPAYEIYDADDNLIFSGTSDQWENENNNELSQMKRKSDFLFESNGTQIYKVF